MRRAQTQETTETSARGTAALFGGHRHAFDREEESDGERNRRKNAVALTNAYKDADLKKPRNFIGLTKSLPDDDMKRALAEHAQHRAQSVRQQLIAKIDSSRVFVVAPKLDIKDVKDRGPTASVDLELQ